MNLSAEETYIVHNLMMEKAYQTLIEMGQTASAQIFQNIAQDATGSFILHNLIHVVMETMELDRITEPTNN